MPRVIFIRWRHSLSLLCFFFIGLFLGLHYWELIIRNDCSSPSSAFYPQPFALKTISFYSHFQYRTISTCEKYSSKIFLTIAVLSSHDRLLEYLPAMFETWLLTTMVEVEVIIFLEETYSGSEEFIAELFSQSNKLIKSCVYIVKLKHVQNEYPPQKKSFYAMKFLHLFYQHRTSWILRLDDNAYVNVPELVKWLKSIDHRRALYIGQGGTGRKNESTIYFPPGKYFCMGGSGIILSQQTLMQLGPWLDQCFKFELRTNHEDVELGRCILTHVEIDCTNAYNSKYLFYHHYGSHYTFGYEFASSAASHAFTIHPVKNRTVFKQIYYFHRRKQQHKSSTWNTSTSQEYVTFLNLMEFDLVRDIHYQLLDVRWKAYINASVRLYLEHLQSLWHQDSRNWTIMNGNYLLGYHRVIPRHGLELIVEILLKIRTGATSPSQSTIVRKRFHTRHAFVPKRQLDYREIVYIDRHETEYQLNLIVVSSNKDATLLRFVHYFQREVLNNINRQQYFTLTILYFHSKRSNIDQIDQLSVRYPSLVRLVIVNETEHRYNRGYGRQLASKYFSSNQLLFFLDVDVIFTWQSLMNTRRLLIHQLSISSCAVYFPIIYSFFSNMFTTNRSRLMADVKLNTGLFSIYGFGNVAARKRDLDLIGGWEIDNNYWGVEDVNLFQRFVNTSSNCYVFRAVEPDLRHSYHKKSCKDIRDEARRKMCTEADVSLLGSQADMVDYIVRKKIVRYY